MSISDATVTAAADALCAVIAEYGPLEPGDLPVMGQVCRITGLSQNDAWVVLTGLQGKGLIRFHRDGRGALDLVQWTGPAVVPPDEDPEAASASEDDAEGDGDEGQSDTPHMEYPVPERVVPSQAEVVRYVVQHGEQEEDRYVVRAAPGELLAQIAAHCSRTGNAISVSLSHLKATGHVGRITESRRLVGVWVSVALAEQLDLFAESPTDPPAAGDVEAEPEGDPSEPLDPSAELVQFAGVDEVPLIDQQEHHPLADATVQGLLDEVARRLEELTVLREERDQARAALNEGRIEISGLRARADSLQEELGKRITEVRGLEQKLTEAERAEADLVLAHASVLADLQARLDETQRQLAEANRAILAQQ